MSKKAEKNKLMINAMRHSMAHILATAVQDLYPGAKFGVGPVIDHGFYYDFDLGRTISEEDLDTIEQKMHEIIEAKQPFEQEVLSVDEAIKRFEMMDQPYKVELINDLKKYGTTVFGEIEEISSAGIKNDIAHDDKITTVTLYKNGPFTDLCRGGHLENTAQAGAFKLTKVSGAYWRGDQANSQMQRIYGVAFETKEELNTYLQQQEEAEKRDHRKLGPALGLYMNSEVVGAGLPLLMPRGETVKHTLREYMRAKEEALGYQYVSTPALAHEELYKRSGHANFYADDMYQVLDDENNVFYLKPMNCPHHHMIYERMVQSYRDLPLRLSEGDGLYRKELSGTLTGLIRVRGPISQNDSHIYIEPKDLKREFMKVLELFKEVYQEVNVSGYWYRLSLPDFNDPKAKFAGDKRVWEEASQSIRDALDEFGANYVEAEGEAAFYGPKLDVQIKNVTGHEDTIATSQVDVLVPHRMGLKYVDEHGHEVEPIIIHRAILGSYERFMAFLIEQTAGNFPVWLSPEQVRLISVNQTEEVVEKCQQMLNKLKSNGIRTVFDNSSESVGKKIRSASMMKVPYIIVVGEKEVGSDDVSPRVRQDLGKEPKPILFEEFIKKVKEEIAARVSRSSL